MRILLLDIETSPTIAQVWGARKVNISNNHIQAHSYVMCWGAKWLGEKEMMFDSVRKSGSKRMLRRIHRMMCEADAIVHYNGVRFDIPTLNGEFLLHGMSPPSPSRQVDLYRTVRKQFRFISNKLEYVAKRLKIGSKLKHPGHEMWMQCLLGSASAWRLMEMYNKRDVVLLEKLYKKLTPWFTDHPDRNLYLDDSDGTPQCAHCLGKLIRKGFSHTASGKYTRFQCTKCGVWHRGKTNMANRRGTQKVTFGS